MTEISTPSGVAISLNGELHLAQSVRVSYQRTVSPIYELGSEDVWMSANPPTGTIDLERVIGSAGGIFARFRTNDACKGVTIKIQQGGGCGASPGVITATDCLLSQLGFSATAGDIKITDTAQYSTACIQ